MRLALARLSPLLGASTEVVVMGLQPGSIRRSARLAGVKVAATSYKSQLGTRRPLGTRSCTAAAGPTPTSTSPSPTPSSSSKPSKSEAPKSRSSKSKSSSKSEPSKSKSSRSESSKPESKSRSKSSKSKSESSAEDAAEGGPKPVGDGRSKSIRVSNAKGRVITGGVAKKKVAATLGRTREKAKRAAGFEMVIGVDEAGRGPFAGPVVAAACFVPPGVDIVGIQDSKKISQHSDREALYKELTETPGVIWATSEVGSRRIDEINILEATKEAMTNCALEVCSGGAPKSMKPFVFVDGNFTPPGLSEVDCQCLIGGDGLEYCIAAASIIAKVTRDRIMIDYGKRWPVFGFEKHKGYGTRAHSEAIRARGMVEIHRRSFLKKMEASGGKLSEYED